MRPAPWDARDRRHELGVRARAVKFGEFDFAAAVRDAAPAALLLPFLAVAGAPVHATPTVLAAIAAVTLIFFAAASRAVVASRWLTLVAIGVIVCLSWALRLASSPGAGWVTAPLFGLAVCSILGAPVRVRSSALVAVASCLLILARLALGREVAVIAGVLLCLPAAALSVRETVPLRPASVAQAGLLAAFGLIVFAFLGATTTRANWFGAAVSHGPRTGRDVALTFDDGPNVNDTLKVADILDAYGVKGTFFLVGKALDARPDIARALLDRGEVLGDHSYDHDSTSWLRPDYPEIGLTQKSFAANLGVCPALFRPPHGTRTPFMTHKASSSGLKTVTWDVSAADWASTDAALVASRVLSRVGPGSIILLHDGLDGDLTADRSVLLAALPIILDGLRQKGLRPVTLPELLHVEAYTPC